MLLEDFEGLMPRLLRGADLACVALNLAERVQRERLPVPVADPTCRGQGPLTVGSCLVECLPGSVGVGQWVLPGYAGVASMVVLQASLGFVA